MPTGYTAPVVDGTITKFSDFAMSCARAFGALIHMRDESNDVPIPEKIPEYTYAQDRLRELRKERTDFHLMSGGELEIMYETAMAERKRYAEECTLSTRASNARIAAMVKQVEAWVPPTPEHVGLKDFMISQLEMSYASEREPQGIPPLDLWRADKLADFERDIRYYTEDAEKEKKRNEERQKWLDNLRGSLPKEET